MPTSTAARIAWRTISSDSFGPHMSPPASQAPKPTMEISALPSLRWSIASPRVGGRAGRLDRHAIMGRRSGWVRCHGQTSHEGGRRVDKDFRSNPPEDELLDAPQEPIEGD